MEVEERNHFFIYPTVLYLLSLGIGFVLWYFLWLRPGYCSFPTGRYTFQRLLRSPIYQPKGFFDFYRHFGEIFVQLDPEYWIPICGTDTYCYLYSQRQIILLSLCMMGIFFSVKTIADLFRNGSTWGLLNTHIKTIDFSSKGVLIEQMLMITTFTVCLIIMFIRMVKHFSKVTLKYYNKVDTLDLKYLQMRTLHVRGMLPEDLKGKILQSRIESYLSETGGNIIAIKIIPNYSGLVQLETKRRDLAIMNRLFQVYSSQFKRFWVPKKYHNKKVYEEELQKLDREIQKMTEKEFLSSGHAFICFNSVATMYGVLKFLHSRLGPQKIFKHTINSINKNVNRLKPSQDKKSDSNMQRIPIEPDELLEKYKDTELIARSATETLDIIWENMGGFRGIHFFRRIFINVLILAILFFISTPSRMLTIVDYYLINLKDYSWVNNISPDLAKLMKTGVPALAILIISGMITVLITVSTGYEKNIYHSEHQKSVFLKSVVYLSYNMILIPGFGFVEQSSAYLAFKDLLSHPRILLKNFYAHDSGSFFVSIIIQASIMFYFLYFLRLQPLFNFYLSPWLVHYRQEYINDVEKWAKKPLEVFEYGYLLAQTLIVFFIILIFSTTVPLIMIMGLLYFGLRHVVDSINLLVFHKMELDSLGTLTKMMLRSIVICCLLFHFCFLGVLVEANAYISVWVLLINIVALLGLYVYVRRPFFDLINLEKHVESLTDIAPEYVAKWQEIYRHPLVLRLEEEKKKGIMTQMEIIFQSEKQSKKEEVIEIKEIKPSRDEQQNSQSVFLELAENKKSVPLNY